MRSIPERWRFSFDNEEHSFRDLSWREAVRVFRDAEWGDLATQADGECVSLEFNATHAAVVYRGRDGVMRRPYFPDRSAESQDLRPFFCDCSGIRLGDDDGYLARFVGREAGLRLFEAVLVGPALPEELPASQSGQPLLAGFEEAVAGRPLEWRPLPAGGREPA